MQYFCCHSPIWETIAASAAVEGDWQRVADRGAALQVLAHHRSVITDAFQGIVVSSVTCPCCAFQEETLDPFFTMRCAIQVAQLTSVRSLTFAIILQSGRCLSQRESCQEEGARVRFFSELNVRGPAYLQEEPKDLHGGDRPRGWAAQYQQHKRR